MKEPAYAYTIPSLHDDISLDCRLYLPNEIPSILGQGKLRGAIVAHPYAPLGGCYDDSVVLSVKDTLLEVGYVVVTFNFRGAGESAGRTSWTGSPEIEDFTSVTGFLIYYLQQLQYESSGESGMLVPIISTSNQEFESKDPYGSESLTSRNPVRLLLAGYSFGSLILARLPPVSRIVESFEAAERGSSLAEIILRARMLAKQTHAKTQESRRPSTPRGRGLDPGQIAVSPKARSSPVTVGGEETDSSQRRRSRDSKRSIDVVRDVPNRIKTHIRRHSGSIIGTKRSIDEQHRPSTTSTIGYRGPIVRATYLLISPVLLPMTTMLLPPGLPGNLALPFGLSNHGTSGVFSWSSSTLLIFGSHDTFTSSKKLRQWATRMQGQSSGALDWMEVEGAAHFWREDGATSALCSKISSWDTNNLKGG